MLSVFCCAVTSRDRSVSFVRRPVMALLLLNFCETCRSLLASAASGTGQRLVGASSPILLLRQGFQASILVPYRRSPQGCLDKVRACPPTSHVGIQIPWLWRGCRLTVGCNQHAALWKVIASHSDLSTNHDSTRSEPGLKILRLVSRQGPTLLPEQQFAARLQCLLPPDCIHLEFVVPLVFVFWGVECRPPGAVEVLTRPTSAAHKNLDVLPH